jgi:hypothetical protein
MEQLNGLISPIIIILVFSLMFFVGICAATIDPASEASPGIERSSDLELCPLNCELYKISPDNAIYNETTNSTNFAYTVSVGNSTCSLENWFLVLGCSLDPKDILSASPAPWEFFETADQSVVYVIKFDTGIETPRVGDPAGSMIYSFELSGNWSGKMALITADIITRGGICSKEVKGPDCQKRIS